MLAPMTGWYFVLVVRALRDLVFIGYISLFTILVIGRVIGRVNGSIASNSGASIDSVRAGGDRGDRGPTTPTAVIKILLPSALVTITHTLWSIGSIHVCRGSYSDSIILLV
tara:strand:+ start:2839 stop:3171 length:333 start_codon:yes stop_codon:yes gene_type:complete